MESDSQIACNIVRKLFNHINLCLQNDRSRVKLNMMEKGIIKGMLSEKTLSGLNNYIRNMNPSDVESLMNDLEVEFSKRPKNVRMSSSSGLINSSDTSQPRFLHMK